MAIAVALALAGCTPAPEDPEPTPSPSSTPLFSSDEEALAAAEEAYAAYLRVSDQITSEGGQNAERIDPLVSDALRDRVHDSFSKYSERGLHTAGNSKTLSFVLQGVTTQSSSTVVDAYICLDVTAVRVIGVDGVDVTPASRPALIPLSVRFRATTHPSDMLIDGSEAWTGDNFCA